MKGVYRTSEDLFWSKVEKTDTCWLWTRHISKEGYGKFRHNGKTWSVHRLAYTLACGPIPEGLDIDHVKARGCTHRHCVNPAHLEPVTRRENILRGEGRAAKQARQTHCLRGHEFAPENTYILARRRYCRICMRRRCQARYQRQRMIA